MCVRWEEVHCELDGRSEKAHMRTHTRTRTYTQKAHTCNAHMRRKCARTHIAHMFIHTCSLRAAHNKRARTHIIIHCACERFFFATCSAHARGRALASLFANYRFSRATKLNERVRERGRKREIYILLFRFLKGKRGKKTNLP